VKPFTARELRARVATHIEAARLRREAEAARRALDETQLRHGAEERLRYLTEAAGVGTWDWAPDSGEVAMSPRARAILEQEVAERTAELRHMNQELDAFTYAVSHDLRGPLRGMRGFAQALLRRHAGQLEGEALEYLHEIDLAGKEMSDLVNGLLALSHSTRSELHVEAVDLSALAEACRDELQRGAPERAAQWRIEPDLTVWGDARLLETVCATCWTTPGNTARTRAGRDPLLCVAARRRTLVLRGRQRRGLRHAPRRATVQPFRTAAP
jgi:signal transduction histidine kinase